MYESKHRATTGKDTCFVSVCFDGGQEIMLLKDFFLNHKIDISRVQTAFEVPRHILGHGGGGEVTEEV